MAEKLNTFIKEMSQPVLHHFHQCDMFLYTKCLYAEIKIVLCFFADINCAQIYCGKIQCLHQKHVTENTFCITSAHYYIRLLSAHFIFTFKDMQIF
jgi:ABC-type hemin transport system ATPase subunit